MKNINALVEVKLPQKKVYLLGTAHISDESVREVREAIKQINPDIVAVELDQERLNRITKKDDSWLDLDLFKIIKEGKSFLLLTSIVLASFQRKLGEHVDTLPGSEMIAAVRECEALNKQIILADRSVTITLKRAWSQSSFWGKQKIIAALVSVVFSKKKIDVEELNELKNKSLEGNVLQELTDNLPYLKKVLLDERDEYMAAKLYQAEGKKVLGIFGAAHVRGIRESLQTKDSVLYTKERIKRLEEIPPRKKVTFFTLIIPVVVAGLLVAGFFSGGWEKGTQNMLIWWLVNGGGSLIGSVFALAHPVTMLVSFIAAPITSLSPLIGVGTFSGLSETFFRTPTGRDITELQKLKLSFRSLYRNKVSRILIVVLATTIGSAIGTFAGISLLALNV